MQAAVGASESDEDELAIPNHVKHIYQIRTHLVLSRVYNGKRVHDWVPDCAQYHSVLASH
jgi:hypothetical protein